MTAALAVGAFAVAAAIGACIRVVAGTALNQDLPFGTLAVNVAGAFALGALSRLDPPWSAVLGAGAVGAAASWAVTANEVAVLARSGRGPAAALYLAATVTTAIVACWAGLQLAGGLA